MPDFTETVRNFIETELVPQTGRVTLSPTDSLLEMGIIDSLGVQRLIAYLEKEFELRIADTEIVPEHFETIGAVVHFINVKLSQKGADPLER